MEILVIAIVALVVLALISVGHSARPAEFCKGAKVCTAGDCFNCATGAEAGVEQTGGEDDYYSQRPADAA